MAIDRERARQYLKAFDFARLFTQELGWDKYSATITKQVDGHAYHFKGVAEKHGVVILVSDSIPEYAVRVKVDKLIAKDHFEHLIVFTDQAHGRQVWQWFRKEPGKPVAVRTYPWSSSHSELLLQKLEGLVFTLEEEEILTLTSVTGRLKAFDVEKVTKKFYERFKTEHSAFLKFIEGIPDEHTEAWYASVMINRLMFLYFIQEKGFLNEDKDYLRNKLKESRDRKPDAYYKDFLCPLFFQGFARKKAERPAAINKLLGEIPYLNGGLFQPHQIEELHGKQIVVPDKAFEKLFNFFREYDWHLDERENRNDREINPDVLGYIFEKYINQKQMGAYYTKEDITEYIAQNTIIPFLLDEARKGCAVAFAPEGSVWRLLQDDPDRYIHDAMKWGADISLPNEIKAGIADVKKRTGWNRPAPEEFALATELWREAIDRHERYRSLKAKLAAGEVHQVNDLVTLNLNIRQFAQDVIQFCEGPELLRTMWKVIEKVSVLDPTCGSGAFLFAALNILKPLYEACLTRMLGFIEDMESAGPHHPAKFSDFKQIRDESKRHPKQDYFILKAIIVNNLFGVDVMEEAVEICKLRLFLKLVAQVESQDKIEPLPDIDFNIRAGNTLVGYSSLADIRPSRGIRTDEENQQLARIEDQALILDAKVRSFRLQQTQLDGTVTAEDKAELRRGFAELETELNDHLSGDYGLKRSEVKQWKASHKPFHWFCDFHAIMKSGGFDIIIGNPPFVEYLKVQSSYSVRNLSTVPCGNLYAFVVERCASLISSSGRFGMIVPISAFCTPRMSALWKIVKERREVWISNYGWRPAKLFPDVNLRLSICLSSSAPSHAIIHTTGFIKWPSELRPYLFPILSYQTPEHDGSGALLRKLSSRHDQGILKKLHSGGQPLGLAAARDGFDLFYKNTGVNHWITATLRAPRAFRNGKASSSSRETRLTLANKASRDAAMAVINSNLFYWHYVVVTNCRDLNPSDLTSFPVPPEALKDEKLQTLARELMESLDEHSRYIIREQKLTGTIKLQSYLPGMSKNLIDEIDQTLAKHYGLTKEELDFIINYDIKYRLGAEADEE